MRVSPPRVAGGEGGRVSFGVIGMDGNTGRPRGRLALAGGAVFEGEAFGATGLGIVSAAEVVFNTAMSGYQESLTDPSYTGQILVQTTPLIGNTGVNQEDVESERVRVAGFVVHELCRRASNYRSEMELDDYLRSAGVLGLTGVDTRAITRLLRTAGVEPGVLTDRDDLSDAELVERARSAPSMAGRNLVGEATGDRGAAGFDGALGDWRPASVGPASVGPASGGRLRVAAIDCGAKLNILRHLTERGCEVRVLPADIGADELAGLFDRGEADGLFISNGPGDPEAVERLAASLRSVLVDREPGRVPPTFGICLGHQLIGRAIGAKTYKLPFGHRGANQPVLDVATGRVEITSQNHGFAIDRDSLVSLGGEVTHEHLNDRTVAGFRLTDRPVFSVQYHPEASPGPHDAVALFDRFVALMLERNETAAAGGA